MATERIKLNPDGTDSPQIEKIARVLAGGALVAIPTETVYGIAANAGLDDSVRRLRSIKGHAADRPFTVHIGRRAACDDFVPDIPPMGRRLIRKGWPGPLTLVFRLDDPARAPAHATLSPEGAAAAYVHQTIGLRLPDHPVAAAILAAAGAPIIASSANETGASPPTTADAVSEALDGRIDLIVDTGRTRYGQGSTIVKLNGTGYELLRTGVYDARTIRRWATVNILFVCTGNTCRSPMAAGIFRKMAAERLSCDVSQLLERGVNIESAGTSGGGGSASPSAVEVCRRRGVDIASHRARALSLDHIRPADRIYTMSRHHLETVAAMDPESVAKTSMLDPGDQDIADPIGGTVEDYDATASKISVALERRLEEVPL
ncbi:MAG: L-threonylcarbamoyladenylate synthase [Phycisphaerae bacterium]